MVVGAAHPNRNGSNRRFEILLCPPGEPVVLTPEPKNPVDPRAVAVFSARGVQIGYLTAERAAWIGGMIRQGVPVEATFQQATATGAVIRVGIDGAVPTLPPQRGPAAPTEEGGDGFWPDYLPPDD